MKLENYGYKVTSMAGSRHSSLGKAVKSVGYKRVISSLHSRKSRYSGYKFKRIRADLNWLKKKR